MKKLLILTAAMFASLIAVATPAQETANDEQCRAWVDASPMVAENHCVHDRDKTLAIVREGKPLLCKVAVRCGYPDWHPNEFKRNMGHVFYLPNGHNVFNRVYIDALKFCVDGLIGTHCDGMTLDNFTKAYRPAMVEQIVKAKSLYPGVECVNCDINDPNCSAINFFAPYEERMHHCRWDGMIAKIQDDRPNYRGARSYAQSIVDKHGWENWKKMVRLIEGRK